VSVTLEIPDEVSAALRLPAPELKTRLQLELAVSLYAQHILGLGKAAELAGLSRWELNDLLSRRGVPMHYSEGDLTEDLAYARRGE
jgi:predicted HTH domain antitoxin